MNIETGCFHDDKCFSALGPLWDINFIIAELVTSTSSSNTKYLVVLLLWYSFVQLHNFDCWNIFYDINFEQKREQCFIKKYINCITVMLTLPRVPSFCILVPPFEWHPHLEDQLWMKVLETICGFFYCNDLQKSIR